MPEVIKLLNDENVKPSLCDSVAVVLTVCSLDQPYRHLLGTHQRPNESDIWGARWTICVLASLKAILLDTSDQELQFQHVHFISTPCCISNFLFSKCKTHHGGIIQKQSWFSLLPADAPRELKVTLHSRL